LRSRFWESWKNSKQGANILGLQTDHGVVWRKRVGNGRGTAGVQD
jgi:hypothetical protein